MILRHQLPLYYALQTNDRVPSMVAVWVDTIAGKRSVPFQKGLVRNHYRARILS